MSECVNQNTTHVRFPHGVDYQSGLDSLKVTSLRDIVSIVTIDWLPDCARKSRENFVVDTLQNLLLHVYHLNKEKPIFQYDVNFLKVSKSNHYIEQTNIIHNLN